jgi:alkanesulfonate monooxygenase SsuD/methylene tetrahydromethanopterin reductase-like flavin-dependent oxidoreductase (luciferase family)
MWVGGRTFRSLRRAAALGDGWAPFGLRTAELDEMLRRVSLPSGFDVVLQNEHPLDPLAEPARVGEQLARFRDIGATAVNVRFVHHSRAHYCEQLDALVGVATSL